MGIPDGNRTGHLNAAGCIHNDLAAGCSKGRAADTAVAGSHTQRAAGCADIAGNSDFPCGTQDGPAVCNMEVTTKRYVSIRVSIVFPCVGSDAHEGVIACREVHRRHVAIGCGNHGGTVLGFQIAAIHGNAACGLKLQVVLLVLAALVLHMAQVHIALVAATCIGSGSQLAFGNQQVPAEDISCPGCQVHRAACGNDVHCCIHLARRIDGDGTVGEVQGALGTVLCGDEVREDHIALCIGHGIGLNIYGAAVGNHSLGADIAVSSAHVQGTFAELDDIIQSDVSCCIHRNLAAGCFQLVGYNASIPGGQAGNAVDCGDVLGLGAIGGSDAACGIYDQGAHKVVGNSILVGNLMQGHIALGNSIRVGFNGAVLQHLAVGEDGKLAIGDFQILASEIAVSGDHFHRAARYGKIGFHGNCAGGVQLCIGVGNGNLIHGQAAIDNIQHQLACGSCGSNHGIVEIHIQNAACHGGNVGFASESAGSVAAHQTQVYRFGLLSESLDDHGGFLGEEVDIIRFDDDVLCGNVGTTLGLLTDHGDIAAGNVDGDVFTGKFLHFQIGNAAVVCGLAGNTACQLAHFTLVIGPGAGFGIHNNHTVADFQEVHHGRIACTVGYGHSAGSKCGFGFEAQIGIILILEQIAAGKLYQLAIHFIEVIRMEMEAVGCQCLCGVANSLEDIGFHIGFLGGSHVDTLHNLVGLDLGTGGDDQGILPVLLVDGLVASEVSTLLIQAEYGMAFCIQVVDAGCLILSVDLLHVQNRAVRHFAALVHVDTDVLADDGIAVGVHRCGYTVCLLVRDIVAVSGGLNDHGAGQILIDGNQIIFLHPCDQVLTGFFVRGVPGNGVGVLVLLRILIIEVSVCIPLLDIGRVDRQAVLFADVFHTGCKDQGRLGCIGIALCIPDTEDHGGTAHGHCHGIGDVQDPAFRISFCRPLAFCVLFDEDNMAVVLQIAAVEPVIRTLTCTNLGHLDNFQIAVVIEQQQILQFVIDALSDGIERLPAVRLCDGIMAANLMVHRIEAVVTVLIRQIGLSVFVGGNGNAALAGNLILQFQAEGSVSLHVTGCRSRLAFFLNFQFQLLILVTLQSLVLCVNSRTLTNTLQHHLDFDLIQIVCIPVRGFLAFGLGATVFRIVFILHNSVSAVFGIIGVCRVVILRLLLHQHFFSDGIQSDSDIYLPVAGKLALQHLCDLLGKLFSGHVSIHSDAVLVQILEGILDSLFRLSCALLYGDLRNGTGLDFFQAVDIAFLEAVVFTVADHVVAALVDGAVCIAHRLQHVQGMSILVVDDPGSQILVAVTRILNKGIGPEDSGAVGQDNTQVGIGGFKVQRCTVVTDPGYGLIAQNHFLNVVPGAVLQEGDDPVAVFIGGELYVLQVIALASGFGSILDLQVIHAAFADADNLAVLIGQQHYAGGQIIVVIGDVLVGCNDLVLFQVDDQLIIVLDLAVGGNGVSSIVARCILDYGLTIHRDIGVVVVRTGSHSGTGFFTLDHIVNLLLGCAEH